MPDSFFDSSPLAGATAYYTGRGPRTGRVRVFHPLQSSLSSSLLAVISDMILCHHLREGKKKEEEEKSVLESYLLFCNGNASSAQLGSLRASAGMKESLPREQFHLTDRNYQTLGAESSNSISPTIKRLQQPQMRSESLRLVENLELL